MSNFIETYQEFIHTIGGGNIIQYDDRGQWLGARSHRLGASDLADLFGVGYNSLYDLWARYAHPEEADGSFKGESDPWAFEAREWGTRLQDVIMEGLADREGWKIEPWPQNCVVQHRELPLACTPDGIARVNLSQIKLVEVKNFSEYAHRSWPRDDDGTLELDPKIQVQIQGQMACTGIKEAVAALMFGGNRLEVVHVKRHEPFQERLVKVIEKFWHDVENDITPEVDGSESTKKRIAMMYPKDDGTAMELEEEYEPLAIELERVSKDRIAAEKREKEIKNILKVAIGNHTWAVTPSGRCFSNKQQSRDGVDGKKLAAHFPDVYDLCLKTSTFRVLRPVKKVPDDAEWQTAKGNDAPEHSPD